MQKASSVTCPMDFLPSIIYRLHFKKYSSKRMIYKVMSVGALNRNSKPCRRRHDAACNDKKLNAPCMGAYMISPTKKPAIFWIAGFLLPLRVVMVAWGGIEPPTQGFSIAVLLNNPALMRVAARKRVTCYIPCYSKITVFRDTFLGNFLIFTPNYTKHTN